VRLLLLSVALVVLPARANAPTHLSFDEVLTRTVPQATAEQRLDLVRHLDAQAASLTRDLRAYGPVDEPSVRAVLQAVRASTDACNAWLDKEGIDWRVTDQEIAVTWIAEGGALLLTTDQHEVDRVHPILGVGLDDIAHGFKELPGLVGHVDAAAGTHVEDIPVWRDGDWELTRHMTLEESVVGTAVMWVWEKRIADRKLRETGRPPLAEHDAHDQFILGSLVYNSGLLHNAQRPRQVRRYALADHLAELARTHNGRRAWLPVNPPEVNLAALLVDRDYPEQGTSWIALYHILQRYGGYDGLERTTDMFDEAGRIRMEPWQALQARLTREAEQESADQPATPQASPADGSRQQQARPAGSESAGGLGCGCRAAPVGSVGWALGLALGLVAMRTRRP